MRLLIVEDEVPLAEGLARGLRREGFSVDVVHDGAEALIAVGNHDYALCCWTGIFPNFTATLFSKLCAAKTIQLWC